MHKDSKKLFNNNILNRAIELFQLDKNEIKSLDGFESFIYEAKYNNENIILRITHSLHRTKNEIEAEIDWINYLSEKELPVAKAYASPQGSFVEVIKVEDSYFLVTVFEKLKGRHLKQEEMDENAFYELGKIIGKMHNVAKSFVFSNPNFTRRGWSEEFNELVQFVPKEEELVHEKIKNILEEVNSLPKDKDSFGLIHTDAHFGNIFIHDGKLSIFDFDDSAYKWFISDIAIVLFYNSMRKYKELAQNEYVDLIMINFMKGYREENRISNFWIDKLPLFLKLREITLYMVIHRSYDVKNIEHPWCKKYMDGRKEKIEKDMPFLEYNFSQHKI